MFSWLLALRLAATALASEPLLESSPPPAGAMDTESYIIMAGFRVRTGHEATFERRWAGNTPLMRLSKGFRFFSLLRRSDIAQPIMDLDDITTPDYIS